MYGLTETKLTKRQQRACLLMIRHGTQVRVAVKMSISQPGVSQHLKASARKYPALVPLIVKPRGRRRMKRLPN